MDRKITATPSIDAQGEYEIFCSDLAPLRVGSATSHLDENGLARKGTQIREGMIIIGKIGKSAKHDKAKEPSALQWHALSSEELRKEFGDLWVDGSIYARREDEGTVTESFLEMANGKARATVCIRPNQASR